MSLPSIIRSFFARRPAATIARKQRRFRPALEMLEDRLAPATFTVDSILNTDNGLAYGNGPTTLPKAIRLANVDTGDTINFSASLNSQTITLTSQLAITKPMTITGPGSTLLTINANGASRIFNVNDSNSATQIPVGISGLKLTGGNTLFGGGIANGEALTLTGVWLDHNTSTNSGGGIYNVVGTLTLENSVLSANSSGDGGGIYNANGSMTLSNVTLSANSATFHFGGGIFNGGTVTLTNSTLSTNSAAFNGGGIYNTVDSTVTITNSTLSGNSGGLSGGGLYNDSNVTITNSTFAGNSAQYGGGIDSDGGILTLSGSTLAGNSALLSGGGIYNQGALMLTNSTLSANSSGYQGGGGIYNNGGTATLTNATLSANSSQFSGGGIFSRSSGIVTLANSTVVANHANSDGVGTESGGGVFSDAGVTTTLYNSIVAGNVQGVGAGTPDDLNGAAPVNGSSAYNLIGDPATAGGLTNGNHGNIVGKSGVLRPLNEILDTTLRNNGGPTETHALIPGSAAIDAGSTAAVPPGVSEVQTVTLSGVINNFFTLTFNGLTTANISGGSATLAADTQTALHNLETIGDIGGSVGVTLASETLTITFGGALANTNVPPLTAAATGGLNAVVATQTDGHAPTDQRGAGFPRVVGTQVDIGAYEMPHPFFTDNFNRTPSTPLGAPWTTQSGGFTLATLAGTIAKGTTAGSNVATVAGLTVTDVDLYADVTFASGATQAGLLARFTDVNNYYAATLTRESTGLYTARLVKYVGGVYSELAVVEGIAAPGNLHLRVVGTTLQMYFNGSLIATAIDSSFASGGVGMRTFGLSGLDNFQACPITTGVDNFDSFAQPDNITLSDPWLQNQGFYRTVGNRIQGGQAVNLATINAANVADVDVRANVSITGINHYASLLARYQSTTDSGYQATLVRAATGFTAKLFIRINGAYPTTLATATIPSVSGNASMRFLVTGSDLKLFVNNNLVFDVLDTTLTSGTVGIRSDNYGFFDDFSVQAVTSDLPFADTFAQPDGDSLSSRWTRGTGDFRVVSGKAIPASPATVSLATLAGVKQANVAVQADIAITNVGDYADLLVCYNGPGDMNYYMGVVQKTVSGYSLFIFRNSGGTFTKLATTTVPALFGPIELSVKGTSLTLYINGVSQISATDSTFTSGSVGIRSIGTATIDNFTATSLAFLPFADPFNPSPTGLGSNWVTLNGGYTVNGTAKGTTALNFAKLGRLDIADVDVSALINVPSTSGSFANLAARISNAASPDFYFATVYYTGASGNPFNMEIYKKIGGVTTLLASTPIPSANGILEFRLVGSQLTASLTGAPPLLSVSDLSLKSGSVGIRSSLTTTLASFGVIAAT